MKAIIWGAVLMLLLTALNRVEAQTSISGIVNDYVAVTAVDYPNNAMTLAQAGSFQSGDEVLIIQMQGASISTSNNSNFGSVVNYQGAGNYEVATICQVSGNVLTFENDLVHQGYQVAGKIQVVRIPRYTSATVTGPLMGRPWDGSLGGVLALRVEDTLLLNAPITMDGMGFRGGQFENSLTNTCGMSTSRTDYSYSSSDMGGHKGEGIANFVNGSEYGRGAQANGGGGGNDHNSGGGGGANAAAGGLGGENQDPNVANCKGYNSGLGGKAPVLTNRLIMGGGGGAGHGNNAHGTRGGNGGGVVIIIAGTLASGSDSTISAKGETPANSSSDGAGGGGAGGSIHLQVTHYAGSLSVDASGGHGGSADNEYLNQCFGPGGGGSGGAVLVGGGMPSNVNVCIKGGNNGHSINTSNFVCTANSSVGAQKGGSGILRVVPLPSGSNSSLACQVLPVEWMWLKVTPQKGRNQVEWAVASERNNDVFTIERSLDGIAFMPLQQVASQGDSEVPVYYEGWDEAPAPGLTYYRIRQTDINGQSSHSEVFQVVNQQDFSVSAYPNPASGQQPLQLSVFLPETGALGVYLFNALGQEVFRKEGVLTGGTHHFSLSEAEMPEGTYFARVVFGGRELTRKLIRLN